MGNLPAGIGTIVFFVAATGLLLSWFEGTSVILFLLTLGIIAGLFTAKCIH